MIRPSRSLHRPPMPWTRTPPPRVERRVTQRMALLMILGFGLCATIAVAVVSNTRDQAAGRNGQAVIRAYQRAGLEDGADAEDQTLTEDEAAAGAMWARAHPSNGPAACPSSPKAFEKGCADWAAKGVPHP